MDVIGVTGATGRLGGRVARRLADEGFPLRLSVRDVRRAPKLPCADVRTASCGDREAQHLAHRIEQIRALRARHGAGSTRSA